MRFRVWLVAVVLMCASAVTAQAQTFRAEFTPSVDHNTGFLTSYDLIVATFGNPTVPLVTVDMGKPTPNAQNVIAFEFTADMQATPRNTRFVARVVAKGPGGASSTPNSLPFDGLSGAPAAPTAAPTIVVLP